MCRYNTVSGKDDYYLESEEGAGIEKDNDVTEKIASYEGF